MALVKIAEIVIQSSHFNSFGTTKDLRFEVLEEGGVADSPLPELELLDDPLFISGSKGNDILHPFMGIQIQMKVMDVLGLGEKLYNSDKRDFAIHVIDIDSSEVLYKLWLYAPTIKGEVFSSPSPIELIATNAFGYLKEELVSKDSDVRTVGELFASLLGTIGIGDKVDYFTDWITGSGSSSESVMLSKFDMAWMSRRLEPNESRSAWDIITELCVQFNLQIFYDGQYFVIERRKRLSAPTTINGVSESGLPASIGIKKDITTADVLAYPSYDYKQGLREIKSTDLFSDSVWVNSDLSDRDSNFAGHIQRMKGWEILEVGSGGINEYPENPNGVVFNANSDTVHSYRYIKQRSPYILSSDDIIQFNIDFEASRTDATTVPSANLTYMKVVFTDYSGTKYYLNQDGTWELGYASNPFLNVVNRSSDSNVQKAFHTKPPTGKKGFIEVEYGAITKANYNLGVSFKSKVFNISFIIKTDRTTKTYKSLTDSSKSTTGKSNSKNNVYSTSEDGNYYVYGDGSVGGGIEVHRDSVALLEQSNKDRAKQNNGWIKRYTLKGFKGTLDKDYRTFVLNIEGYDRNILPIEYRWNMVSGEVIVYGAESVYNSNGIDTEYWFGGEESVGGGSSSGGGSSGGGSTPIGEYFKISRSLSDGNLPQIKQNLELVVGTDVQAWNEGLDEISGLIPFTNDFLVYDTEWKTKTPAQSRLALNVYSKSESDLRYLQDGASLGGVGLTWNVTSEKLDVNADLSHVTGLGTLTELTVGNLNKNGGIVYTDASGKLQNSANASLDNLGNAKFSNISGKDFIGQNDWLVFESATKKVFGWELELNDLTTPVGPVVTIYTEGLDTGSLPVGWSQVDIDFRTTDGGYALFNSQNTSVLTSKVIDLSGLADPTISFDVAKFGSGNDGPVLLEISFDGGASWSQIEISEIPVSSTYLTTLVSLNASSAQTVFRFSRLYSTSSKRLRNIVVKARNSVVGGDRYTFKVGSGALSIGAIGLPSIGIFSDSTVSIFQDMTMDGTLTALSTSTFEDVGTFETDLYVDRNLYVKGGLFATEFIVNQTRVQFDNAMSVGGGKISTVSGVVGSEVITFEDENGTKFVPVAKNDIIHIQKRTGFTSGTIVKNIWREVIGVYGNNIQLGIDLITWSTGADVGTIVVGDDCVVKGNPIDGDRQHYILYNISDVNAPSRTMFTGITDVENSGGSIAFKDGNLNGSYGFSVDAFGVGIGDSDLVGNHIVITPTLSKMKMDTFNLSAGNFAIDSTIPELYITNPLDEKIIRVGDFDFSSFHEKINTESGSNPQNFRPNTNANIINTDSTIQISPGVITNNTTTTIASAYREFSGIKGKWTRISFDWLAGGYNYDALSEYAVEYSITYPFGAIHSIVIPPNTVRDPNDTTRSGSVNTGWVFIPEVFNATISVIANAPQGGLTVGQAHARLRITNLVVETIDDTYTYTEIGNDGFRSYSAGGRNIIDFAGGTGKLTLGSIGVGEWEFKLLQSGDLGLYFDGVLKQTFTK